MDATAYRSPMAHNLTTANTRGIFSSPIFEAVQAVSSGSMSEKQVRPFLYGQDEKGEEKGEPNY